MSAVQFGGGASAIAQALNINMEEATLIEQNFLNSFKGIKEFKIKGSKRVRELGYVLMNETTGHKMYWYGHSEWIAKQKSFTSSFWEEYRELKILDPEHPTVEDVKEHFKVASKWDRMALNAPTQGSGAIIMKEASVDLFNWIVDNGYFNVIKIVNITHDELNTEFPKELESFYPQLVADIMKTAGAKYFTKLEYPAEYSVGDHWIH